MRLFPGKFIICEVVLSGDSSGDFVIADMFGDEFIAFPIVMACYADNFLRDTGVKATIEAYGGQVLIDIFSPHRFSLSQILSIIGPIPTETALELDSYQKSRFLRKGMAAQAG